MSLKPVDQPSRKEPRQYFKEALVLADKGLKRGEHLPFQKYMEKALRERGLWKTH